jgi:hypothetical protein
MANEARPSRFESSETPGVATSIGDRRAGWSSPSARSQPASTLLASARGSALAIDLGRMPPRAERQTCVHDRIPNRALSLSRGPTGGARSRLVAAELHWRPRLFRRAPFGSSRPTSASSGAAAGASYLPTLVGTRRTVPRPHPRTRGLMTSASWAMHAPKAAATLALKAERSRAASSWTPMSSSRRAHRTRARESPLSPSRPRRWVQARRRFSTWRSRARLQELDGPRSGGDGELLRLRRARSELHLRKKRDGHGHRESRPARRRLVPRRALYELLGDDPVRVVIADPEAPKPRPFGTGASRFTLPNRLRVRSPASRKASPRPARSYPR